MGVIMKSFVAVLASLAMATAQYASIGYAAQPIGAAVAPIAGLYAGSYDPSVAYSRAYPLAEPYVHVEVPAEPYVDVQVPAEPYIHFEPVAAPVVSYAAAP